MSKVEIEGFDNVVKYIKDNNLTDMRVYSTDGKSNFGVNKEGELCDLNVRCITSTFEVKE